MITAPAASAVMSLFCPKAMPTVAAVSAGASLKLSPKNRVFARLGLLSDKLQFLFRTLACVDFLDAHLIGQIAHFGFSISGDAASAGRSGVSDPDAG